MGEYDRSKIYDSVKESLGINIEDTTFDNDILMFISTELSILNQMGIGKQLGLVSVSNKWIDFKDTEQIRGNEAFEMVKQFVFISVRLVFDPPPANIEKILNDSKEEIRIRLLLQYGNGGKTL